MTGAPDCLIPDWPVPAGVRAVVTTRRGGVSVGPYASLNLAAHLGDDPSAVAENRRRLCAALDLPSEPRWLTQVHGATVTVAGRPATAGADATVVFESGPIAAVLIADCLPVFLAGRKGDRVGLAHAGWRGLVAGVIEATIEALAADPAELIAWLGPAIGPQAFEVGDEVRRAFVVAEPAAAAHFMRGRNGRWLADLPGLARQRLLGRGVSKVHGCGLCTVADPARFFSYRRDGRTGRMAALAWLA